MSSSDWSYGIPYHIFDTRPDTEFNVKLGKRVREDLAPVATWGTRGARGGIGGAPGDGAGHVYNT